MSDVILRALREVVDASRIETDREALWFFAHDALHPERLAHGASPAQPLCLMRPQYTAEVASIVRLANQHRTPVIPLGGGSGLMGGAASVVPGIVLDLRDLQQVSVRPLDRMVDVGAGVTMHTLNQKAAPYGLMCGHDPWTVSVATVGGTIATNSLGYLGGKYGAMGDQVLGIEVVLPTGEVVQSRGVEKSSTGPVLHRLFVGSEGCFGIITGATLRLFALPATRVLQGWEFQDFATGFEAVNALLGAGLRPGLLEYGDQEPSAQDDPPATLIVSYEGPHRVAQAEAEESTCICERYQGRPLPEQAAIDFWQKRHARGDAYAESRAARRPWYRARPSLDYLHVALPPSAVLQYRRQCLEVLAHHQLQVHQTGLWDHAGLFSLLYTANDVALLTDVHRELLTLCQDLQGAMEYCHGVGVRLASLMGREHAGGLELMRRLKRCLDPHGVLNPGKMALDGLDTV